MCNGGPQPSATPAASPGASMTSPPGPGTCGDGRCGSGESCFDCEADCGACGTQCGQGNGGQQSCSQGCCSKYGFCGFGDVFCGAGCQQAYGMCNGGPQPSLAPSAAPSSNPPFCGDNVCGSGESCGSCPNDCGACPPFCGNGVCEAGESCGSCPNDCGVCPQPSASPMASTPSGSCGNGRCEVGESCFDCEADCGSCGTQCGQGNGGNRVCAQGCCSKFGFCGLNDLFCGEGCQEGFGSCSGGPQPSATPLPPNTCGDGMCSGDESCSTCTSDCGSCRLECGPGDGGDQSCVAGCCGPSGWCGFGASFCGVGCQQGYGMCDPEPMPSAMPTPSPSYTPRPLRCGRDFGDSSCTPGFCCSQFGWCGVTDAHVSFGSLRFVRLSLDVIAELTLCGFCCCSVFAVSRGTRLPSAVRRLPWRGAIRFTDGDSWSVPSGALRQRHV